MGDSEELDLSATAVRYQIESYSQQHPDEFAFSKAGGDDRDRIPMKKLMKLFAIKKKSSMERQNLFREIVNDICELEMDDVHGKVLVLRDDVDVNDCKTYGDVSVPKTSGGGDGNNKPSSVTSAEEVGRYEYGDNSASGPQRTNGYRRRNSVTRYSVVAQDAVLEEYTRHEDQINAFRKASTALADGVRRMSVGGGSGSGLGKNSTAAAKKSNQNFADTASNDGFRKTGAEEVDEDGNIVKKMYRRARRFSLAFS